MLGWRLFYSPIILGLIIIIMMKMRVRVELTAFKYLRTNYERVAAAFYILCVTWATTNKLNLLIRKFCVCMFYFYNKIMCLLLRVGVILLLYSSCSCLNSSLHHLVHLIFVILFFFILILSSMQIYINFAKVVFQIKCLTNYTINQKHWNVIYGCIFRCYQYISHLTCWVKINSIKFCDNDENGSLLK